MEMRAEGAPDMGPIPSARELIDRAMADQDLDREFQAIANAGGYETAIQALRELETTGSDEEKKAVADLIRVLSEAQE